MKHTPSPQAPSEPTEARAPVYVEEPFYAHQDEGIDLREILDILVRGRWILLLAVLAVGLPVAVWTMTRPAQYASYALMLVEKKDKSLGDVLPSGGASAAFFSQDRNLENEILTLRQSMPLALSVADSLYALREVPGTRRGLTIVEPVKIRGGERPATVQDVAFRLQSEYVSVVQEGKDADALRVTAVSEDPAEAALIANLYSKAFVLLSQSSSRATTNASRTFLENQVTQRRADVEALDGRVREFMTREGAVALDQETSQMIEQLATLESQRDAAVVETQVKRAGVAAIQAELARVEPRLPTRVASGADGQIEAAQARIVAIQAELEPYYIRNPAFRTSDDVPDVITRRRDEIERLEARIGRLSTEITQESIAAGAGGPGDTQLAFKRVAELRQQKSDRQIELDGLVAQQAALNSQIADIETGLKAIPGQSIDLAQLQRERMGAERLYNALDEKLQEARVAEQSQLGYATLIRPAFVAPEPFAPSRARNIGLGLMLGLMLGVVAAIARVRLDHRIHRPDDLTSIDFPLIGTIPDMEPLLRKEFGKADRLTLGERSFDLHLVTLINPMATVSETYRALRTSIQFSRPDAEVRTLLVTSSNPSEGKSVTSANIAIVMAQAGRRVLLVDADLRRPTVHRKFGISRDPGLVQALFDDGPFDPSTAVEVADGLFVLPAGMIAPNPSEMLGSRRMRDFLAAAHEAFDLVILDAPPVLAATDAALLSTQADATLLVARAGETRDYDLQSAREALVSVGAKLIGVVLNGFDVSQAYGYKYKYAYRYGQDYAYGHDSNAPR